MYSRLIGKFVLVHTESMEIYAGTLDDKVGEGVCLTDAYRIRGHDNKIVGPFDVVEITRAVEVIAVSKEIQDSIRGGKWEIEF